MTNDKAKEVIETLRREGAINLSQYEVLMAQFRIACFKEDAIECEEIRAKIHALVDVMLDNTATLCSIVVRNPG